MYIFLLIFENVPASSWDRSTGRRGKQSTEWESFHAQTTQATTPGWIFNHSNTELFRFSDHHCLSFSIIFFFSWNLFKQNSCVVFCRRCRAIVDAQPPVTSSNTLCCLTSLCDSSKLQSIFSTRVRYVTPLPFSPVQFQYYWYSTKETNRSSHSDTKKLDHFITWNIIV